MKRDPQAMTPAERLAEMGAILALGYRRLQIEQKNRLDGPGPDQRACELPGLGTESLAGQEAAPGAVPQRERRTA